MAGGPCRGDTGGMENQSRLLYPAADTFDVFIVDGSQPVRERLEEMIASVEGARCTGSVATAAEAIGGILGTHPDAVILEIGLAQGSGFDVLRALQGRNAGSAVYVLSNFVMEPYQRMAIRLGASAFFDKTTQIEAMRDLLIQRAARNTSLPH